MYVSDDENGIDGEDEEPIDDIDDDFELDMLHIAKAVHSSTQSRKSAFALPPPLPLVRFTDFTTSETEKANTFNGIKLPDSKNDFGEPLFSIPASESPLKGEPIFSPILSRLLAKWFRVRANREAAVRQSECDNTKVDGLDVGIEDKVCKLMDIPLYQNNNFFNPESGANVTEVDSNSNESSIDLVDTMKVHTESASGSIVFDSNFESGNLFKAVRVVGREGLMDSKTVEEMQEYITPLDVYQEYDLTVRKDIFTDGNIQWFYFSANCVHFRDLAAVSFPLAIRFNIINMQKSDALFNYGMRPAVCVDGGSWLHAGEDVCYFKNGQTRLKLDEKRKKRNPTPRRLFTLSFTYVFKQPSIVHFAHSFPYTYSDLQRFLRSLESDTRVSEMMHRKLLCRTLAGNRCDLLTITARANDAAENIAKPAVVLSARVHPGESNASFVLHGIIEFLISATPEADLLRRAFVFKIVPMLNPDGVVHGNYRCALSGVDLNRRYQSTSPSFHPTIAAFKAMLRTTHAERKVLLFLDLHGHSKKKNAFAYGCDPMMQPAFLVERAQTLMRSDDLFNRRVHTRIFPNILARISNSRSGGFFSYSDSNFNISKSKLGTGRVVSWNEYRIEGSYTIEASFCSSGNNNETQILKYFDQNVSLFKDCSSRIRSKVLSYKTNPYESSDHCESFDSKLEDSPLPRLRRSMKAAGSAGIAFRNTNVRKFDTHEGSPQPLLIKSSSKLVVQVDGKKSSEDIKQSNSTGIMAVRNLLKSYESMYQYSKEDFKSMGRVICVAIIHYANLGNPIADYEEAIEQKVIDLKIYAPSTNLSFSLDNSVAMTPMAASVSPTTPASLIAESNEMGLFTASINPTQPAVVGRDRDENSPPGSDNECGYFGGDSDVDATSHCESGVNACREDEDESKSPHPTPVALQPFLLPTMHTVPKESIFQPITSPAVFSEEAFEYGKKLLPVLEALCGDGAPASVGLRFKCELEIRKSLFLSYQRVSPIPALADLNANLTDINSMRIRAESADSTCDLPEGREGREDGEAESGGSDSEPSVDNIISLESVQDIALDSTSLLDALSQIAVSREKSAERLAKKNQEKKRKRKKLRSSIFDSPTLPLINRNSSHDSAKAKPNANVKSIKPVPKQSHVFPSQSLLKLASPSQSTVSKPEAKDDDSASNQSPLQVYYRTLLAGSQTKAVAPVESIATMVKRDLRHGLPPAEEQHKTPAVIALSFSGKLESVSSASSKGNNSTKHSKYFVVDDTLPSQDSIPGHLMSSFEKLAVLSEIRNKDAATSSASATSGTSATSGGSRAGSTTQGESLDSIRRFISEPHAHSRRRSSAGSGLREHEHHCREAPRTQDPNPLLKKF